MTNISNQATAAREEVRTASGNFGEQQHSAPETVLGEAPTFVGETGPFVPVISIATGDGYEQFTLAEARTHLNIPASEDDATVIAVANLLAKGPEDYPPFASEEPSYGDPGDDGTIDVSHWLAPAQGVTWESAAPAWFSDDGRFYVSPEAVLDPANYGYTAEQSDAFENMVGRYAYDKGDLAADCAEVHLDGKLRLRMTEGFSQEEFVPRIIERRFAEMFAKHDPYLFLEEVKRNGIVLDNETLAAGREVENPRAIAYAAASGRAPTDAEVLAVIRQFRVTSTISQGWLDGTTKELAKFGSNTNEADNTVALKALNAWYTGRKKD